ncbi:hypothetical protein FH972_027224 [Carpinus fangiana]|uniref:IPO4/5-like TPR repeats domain-containing protein n=1 Tax=Carpinus fangiana TaxID=176857 RepID=A0A5N6L6F6_9ROSI|nr:hypothetical protein FH972_027224 [Carpinus fangiana]
MFQCVTSDNLNLQELALLIFAQLAHYIGETLAPHLTTLHGVFLNCLGSPRSSEVKIAALGAAVNFVQCLLSSSDRDRFQDLLSLMMRTLIEALNWNQEATALEALELLIEFGPGIIGQKGRGELKGVKEEIDLVLLENSLSHKKTFRKRSISPQIKPLTFSP